MKKTLITTVFLLLCIASPVFAFDLVEVSDSKEKEYGFGVEYGTIFTRDFNSLTSYGISGVYNLSNRTAVQVSCGIVSDYSTLKSHPLITGKYLYRWIKKSDFNTYVMALAGNYRTFPSLGAGIGFEWDRLYDNNLQLKVEVGYTLDRLMIFNSGLTLYF